MTRSAPPTTCASNPDATLVDRIAHPTPIATPSGQTPMTRRALRHRRHHLLPSRHVLGHRLLPRPDNRHPTGARPAGMSDPERNELSAATPPPLFLTIEDAAAFTGLTNERLRRLARAQKLPYRGSLTDPLFSLAVLQEIESPSAVPKLPSWLT